MDNDGAKLLFVSTMLPCDDSWWHHGGVMLDNDGANFDFIQLCSCVMTDGGIMVALQWDNDGAKL